jgi:hypothetical protein
MISSFIENQDLLVLVEVIIHSSNEKAKTHVTGNTP